MNRTFKENYKKEVAYCNRPEHSLQAHGCCVLDKKWALVESSDGFLLDANGLIWQAYIRLEQ
jgi:hypothetical protein